MIRKTKYRKNHQTGRLRPNRLCRQQVHGAKDKKQRLPIYQEYPTD
ncbi:TPA: hypothetical protein ACLYE8_001293 [Streptococcus pneumoniae]|nr:hypothetical protein [Streptococcus pneumoniae]